MRPTFDPEPKGTALLLTEEATRIADGETGVSAEVWATVRKSWDENQAAVLTAQVAIINFWNRINIVLQNPAGQYEPGQWG